MAGRGAAAVKVAAQSGAGAGDAALGVSADVDDGNLGGERRGCCGGGLCGLERRSSSRGGAGRVLSGEGLQAGGRVAVGGSRVAPAVLATAFASLADLVVVAGAAVLGDGNGCQREKGEGEGAHYDYFF